MKRLAAIALLPLALAAFAPQPPDDNAAARLTFEEERKVSSDVMDAIKRQLIENGCWADHRDMPEAKRLSVIFRIQLGPDGHFSAPPRLLDPMQAPANDKPMQTFIAYARQALETCNTQGWQLPEGASEVLRDSYIDLMFVPRIG